jgi:hypothetical protein
MDAKIKILSKYSNKFDVNKIKIISLHQMELKYSKKD